MSDEPLHVERVASGLIGTANMGSELRAAMDASTTQPVPGAIEEVDEAIAALKLKAVPAATQADGIEDEEEDDDLLAKVKEAYPNLNSMSYRLKDLHAQLCILLKRGSKNPYDMLLEMQKLIDEMDEGEDKQQSIQAFNTIIVLFSAVRENDDLRVFVADLFSSFNNYREDKPKIAELHKEINILNDLYDTQQQEQMLAAFEKQKEQRRAMLAAKGAAAAAKAEEKAEAAEAKKRKK